MQRNSNTLFLIAPGATTLVPWVYDAPDFTTLVPWVDGAPDFPGFTEPTLSVQVNGAPDFSGFTEPTLSVLQTAWADFLASGEELEVIADPEPIVPVPAPQWTDFNIAMLSNTEWQSWKTLLPNDLVVALISASVIGKEDAFQSAYEIGKLLAPPTLTQIQNWQSVADQYAIPIVF